MVRIGIIGAGRIGRVHAESLANRVKNAHVCAIADPFMNEEMKHFAKDLRIEQCYSDYHAILDDPAIDAVFICSSTDTHASISIEAIKAGKHVFCEKPISQDCAKIAEVMDVLQHHPVKYQVGFNRRFDHNFEAVKKAICDGSIGVPHIIKITSRDPEPPPAEYVAVSGGMFLDMSIHDFDMVRFLSDSEVTEVYASGAVLVDPAIGKAGDIDTAIVTLKLANGCLAVIDNSRKACYGYDQRVEVFGSKGQASVANDCASQLVLSTNEGIVSEKPLYFFLERYMNAFTKEEELFVNAIEHDTDVPVSIYDGLAPVQIALAANRSLKEGRAVLLSELT